MGDRSLAAEYFERYVKRAYKNYLEYGLHNDDYYLRVLCLFLDHMTDYSCQENGMRDRRSRREFRKKLGEDLPDYNVIQAICEGTKHTETSIHPSKAKIGTTSPVYAQVFIWENGDYRRDLFGEKVPDRGGYMMYDDQENMYFINSAVKNVMNYWEKELNDQN